MDFFDLAAISRAIYSFRSTGNGVVDTACCGCDRVGAAARDCGANEVVVEENWVSVGMDMVIIIEDEFTSTKSRLEDGVPALFVVDVGPAALGGEAPADESGPRCDIESGSFDAAVVTTRVGEEVVGEE